MSKFDLVAELFQDIPYMRQFEAEILRDLILQEGARKIIEVGFYQGKSSAYIGAILEDQGEEGSLLTLDMASARRHRPNIEDLLEKAGLAQRVTPIFCKRSYTWELQRLISAPERPLFDFCYFDGGHTWDSTGFGVLLIDMLLRPGGLLLLDDMDWTMSRSKHYQSKPELLRKFDADEVESKPVRLVWDTVLTHLGYEQVREYPDAHWGLARKPF
ncbi:hypothetical protein RGUI_3092 [Rhodovulum sp. P5]|uniref:class I SAM-dependent methyltransferase n=1 Tax=Rhodovulum sp. P5 TaxID=1564506 RepID=UPI0009C34152|nr:class I SAM-dependent methyltransferase [Rhodovulum sp. P5]ARE41233.1 hypothetical protein RGUI_3092 [Rhodovulum sp. P5]